MFATVVNEQTHSRTVVPKKAAAVAETTTSIQLKVVFR